MSTILFIIAIFVVIIIYFIASFIHRLQQVSKHLDIIPGPKPLPIIGNVLELVGTQEHVWKNLRFLNKKYYPIFRLWSTSYDTINIRHPDDVEKLLSSSKNISKSLMYNFMHDWFGTGLLTSTGRKWQERRKILTPAFHFNVLRQFADIFDKEGNCMVNELLQLKNKSIIIDIVPFIAKYTLNTICETAMDTSLSNIESSSNNFHNLYRKSIHNLGGLLIHRMMRPWLYSNLIFPLTSAGQLFKKSLMIVRGFSRKIIDERQKYHDDTQGIYLRSLNESNDNDDKITSLQTLRKKLAMLDLLIAAMNNGLINNDGIQEEVDTFIFEGHDTTAAGLCFTLLLLAEHRDIQQRVRDEVDEVMKKCEDRMGITELQQLNYLDRCIKEALRLYPSVPSISREITENIQLNKYLIPIGTIVNVHIYDVHRDPNFWPDPDRYDPDRFLPERIQGRHPYSYIPFSAGPRNCIGQKFAMMELKAMIGHLIHNFYLEPVDLAKDVIFSMDLVLRPKNPIRVKFVPR